LQYGFVFGIAIVFDHCSFWAFNDQFLVLVLLTLNVTHFHIERLEQYFLNSIRTFN